MPWWSVLLALLGVALLGLAIFDVSQRRHAVLRNFPIVGHLRYLLEMVGPELRQYIVTDNNAERPFSRDERRWVYASAKGEINLFGFGTDDDLDFATGKILVKHSAFPLESPPPGARGAPPDVALPRAKVLGAARGRRHAFRMASLVNISSMSFGSLSAAAVEALNRGAALAGCLQGTGEGGVSPAHLHGGELVWQVGTGYFGCRDERGRFDLARALDVVAEHPVRAIEIKMSQGAKPGKGGLLPAAKVTPEIAALRGVPAGVDCVSPAGHSAFGDVDEMLDFVEGLAAATGLPVGIKSAVGDQAFWGQLAALMEPGSRGVDFILIDGGEGGTGAGPLVFADNVALPFFAGFSRVLRIFAEAGIEDRVVFGGSARLGLPGRAVLAMALGVDYVNVGREAMLSIGCIQAQRCHTGRCPTGVATQSKYLQRGLDPALKSVRAATYVRALRGELVALANAVGVVHPALLTTEHIDLVVAPYSSRSSALAYGYEPGWGSPGVADREAITALMRRP